VRQLELKIKANSGGTTKPAPGTYTFDKGKTVSITANPDPLFEFAGWAGRYTGQDNPISLEVTSNSAITANFRHKLYAPVNFSGQRIMNRSLFMKEYINQLEWQANPDNQHIVKSRIYESDSGNNRLLGEVDSGILSFQHRGVKAEGIALYGLTAVNSENIESEMVYVTIQ
jgi:hypothetical protein